MNWQQRKIESYEVKRIMARTMAITSRCPDTNRLDFRKNKNFGTDVHKNLFQYGVDELEGYPTKTSNKISSVKKREIYPFKEEPKSCKDLSCPRYITQHVFYNATTPNKNV